MTHLTYKKYRPLYATIYLVIFLILATLVKLKSPLITNFDTTIQKLLLPITTPYMTALVDKITFLGGPGDVIYLLFIALLDRLLVT